MASGGEMAGGATGAGGSTRAALDPPGWRGRLAGPFAPVRVAAIGMRRTGGLLAVVCLGMLVAVTLICTVPLYTGLVSAIQLQYALQSRPSTEVNVETLVTSAVLSAANAQAIDARIAEVASRRLAGFAPSSMSYVQGGGIMLLPQINGKDSLSYDPPVLPLNHPVQIMPYGFDLGQAAPHMRIFDGRLPRETAPGEMPEALVTNRMDKVKVGDTLTLAQFGSPDLTVTVRVVGVWYPKDASDPFWNGASFDTPPPDEPPPPPPPPVYPVLFAENAFYSALAIPPKTPGERPMGMVLHYISFTDPQSIRAEQLAADVADVTSFRALAGGSLLGPNGVRSVLVGTSLDKILAGLRQQLSLLGLPLAIVVAQVVGLALFFVVAMGGLLVERGGAEIATLKSRGASRTQFLLGYGLQGVVLAGLAGLTGPPLAALLSLALVRAFVPAAAGLTAGPLGQRYLMQAATSPAVLWAAAAGAGLGVLALVLAAWRAARLDVLAFRREQGRAGQEPLWKRYYLDVGLALLCAAGYLELGQFGGLDVRAQLGVGAAGPDPLLLAAPALLLLAGALFALRLFPLGARLGAWIAARGRGAAGVLAFAQVRGAAGSVGSLTLLLTLGLGLGLFALDFASSLARNATDRAAYAVGAEERLTVKQESLAIGRQRAAFARLPGVEGVTPAYRSQAMSQGGQALTDSTLLGVDSATFGAVASWRADYAPRPLAALMAEMRAHTYGDAGAATAGDAGHPLWALLDTTLAATLRLRAGDRFTLAPSEGRGAVFFVVGAVVQGFPTLYPTLDGYTGYLVCDVNDYLAALNNPALGGMSVAGPNEYWLRTTDAPADQAAREQALRAAALGVTAVRTRRELLAELRADLVSAGMTGMLLVGALAAAALAVIGGVAQSALAARRRVTQFAILRTLGVGAGQLTRMLLGEQAIIYLYGLIGGTLLGLLLSTATLPFLTFTDSFVSTEQPGVPPYILVFNGTGAALLYGALALAAALGLAWRLAAASGLGRALRLGED